MNFKLTKYKPLILINACKRLKDHLTRHPGSRLLLNLTAESLQDPSLPELINKLTKAIDPKGQPLVIQFSDGDGDLGLSQSDTMPPFCTSCEFHQNLHCDYQEWRGEEWFEIILDPNAGQIPFYYRVPIAEPTGQSPALNGTIAVDMPTWYLNSDYDSLRFQSTLFDRSLNESNKVFTPVLLKP